MAIADVTVQLVQGKPKSEAVVSDSITAPIGSGIAIGFSACDNKRQVEIIDGIKRLGQFFVDVIIEYQGNSVPPNASFYLELELGAGTNRVAGGSPSAAPAAGNIFLSFGDAYDYTKGTISISTDVEVASRALIEHLKGF